MRRAARLAPVLMAVLIIASVCAAPVEAGGRVRLIVPDLGINVPVRSVACGTPRLPDGRTYAWGCTPAPNRYLLSHAYGDFQPLRLAAEARRLRLGMRLMLRFPGGRREYYRIANIAIFRTTRPWPARIETWLTSTARAVSLQTCLYHDSSGRVVAHFVPVR